MRKLLSYSAIILSLLLLFSCSNEEIIPSINKERIEMPISIEIASSSQTQLESKSGEVDLTGTCDADKVLLLVYEGATSITDRRNLTYQASYVLDCENLGTNKKKAYGTITGAINTNYSIFAIGYNSTKENFQVLASDGTNISSTTTYGDTQIVLNTISEGSLNRYTTPELFVGSVMPKNINTEVFTVTGEAKLTGTLYRAVGKGEFTITNIPPNIKKICWLTEKLATYNILYRENNGQVISKYPMGIPTDKELRKELSVVDVKTNTENIEWETKMESFFIPLKESLFYIDATDENNKTTRYLVKCADKFSNTQWLYVGGYGVLSYRFSIPHNYRVVVKGRFEQLENSSNMLIDLSPIENIDGGFLPGGII